MKVVVYVEGPSDKIVKACPQRFAPFVAELKALAEGRDPDGATDAAAVSQAAPGGTTSAAPAAPKAGPTSRRSKGRTSR